MALFIENTLSTNNHIAISNKIRNIPLFLSHFLPIIDFKNLDENYNVLEDSVSNSIQREIKYKLIQFPNNDFTDFNFNNGFNNGFNNHFSKSLYQVFLGCLTLHEYNISYTVNDDSFVTINDDHSPLLHNFSNSFYFPVIRYGNLRSYFSLSLLQNPYIPIDIFVITYIIHNNITIFDNRCLLSISELFFDGREKINKNTIIMNLSYFLNYPTEQIIKYLLQFKFTWTYYSLSQYFIVHYSEQLRQEGLYNILSEYVNFTFKERDVDLINNIHEKIFVI